MIDTEVKVHNNLMFLEYKGHEGTVEFDAENNLLCGHLICPKLISGYHGTTVEELYKAFKDAVDDAIEDGLYEQG